MPRSIPDKFPTTREGWQAFRREHDLVKKPWPDNWRVTLGEHFNDFIAVEHEGTGERGQLSENQLWEEWGFSRPFVQQARQAAAAPPLVQALLQDTDRGFPSWDLMRGALDGGRGDLDAQEATIRWLLDEHAAGRVRSKVEAREYARERNTTPITRGGARRV